jgi:hypothetical protein
MANSTVGTITVTMTPGSPPFLGTVALNTTAPYVNSGGFQITGSGPWILETAGGGGTSSATYTDVKIQASGGYSNSPQSINPTLTPGAAFTAGSPWPTGVPPSLPDSLIQHTSHYAWLEPSGSFGAVGSGAVISVTGGGGVVSGQIFINVNHWIDGANVAAVDNLQGYWLMDGVPFSPLLTGQSVDGGSFPYTFDSSAYPDGPHMFNFRVVNSEVIPLGRYVLSGPYLVFTNHGAAPNAPVRVPLSAHWMAGMPRLPDFHTFTSNILPQPVNAAIPFTPVVSPANSANGLGLGELVIEPTCGAPGAAYVRSHGPRWTMDDTGVGLLQTGFLYNDVGSFDADGYNFNVVMLELGRDGDRFNAQISPLTTYIDTLDGTGWYGVSMDGRLFKRTFDGHVTTIAGRLLASDTFAWDPSTYPRLPETPNSDARLNGRAQFIGNFSATPGGNMGGWWLKNAVDLCIDPRNHAIIYLSLQVPSVIVKVDISTSPATVTLYAGTLQTNLDNVGGVGYVDGPALSAQFSEQGGICMLSDGRMIVADSNNAAIRMISADGSTVSTVAGGTASSQPPPPITDNPPTRSPTGTVPVASNFVAYPYWVRLTSSGTIILIENYNLQVRELDLGAGTLRYIGTYLDTPADFGAGTFWAALEVDSVGTIGPVDRIYLAVTAGDNPMWIMNIDGSNSISWFGIGGTGLTPSCANEQYVPNGYFPWMFAVHRTQNRAIATWIDVGTIEYRGQPFTHDPFPDSDLAQFEIWCAGLYVFLLGSAQCFPYNVRPSFKAFYGDSGVSYLGLSSTNNSFEEIAQLTQAQRYAFYQAGMLGTTPRPELTGNDLRNLDFYVMRSSYSGSQPTPFTPGPDDPDTGNNPIISGVTCTRLSATSVQVSWVTNKPTIGLAAATPQPVSTQAWAYGPCSPLEAAYGTSHTVVISNLPPSVPINVTAVSKDMAGNCSYSTNVTIP